MSDDINAIVNDLSPEARAAALRASEAAGLPLEQWLARVILRASAVDRKGATSQPAGQPYIATRNAAAPAPQLVAIRRYIASVANTGNDPSGAGAGAGAIGLLEHRIAKELGAKCVIAEREGTGTITLHYENHAERLRLLARLAISHPDR